MDKVQLTSSSRPLGTLAGTYAGVGVANIPEEVKSVRFVQVVYREVQVVDPVTGSFIIKVRPEVKRVQDSPVTMTADGREATFDAPTGETFTNSTILAYGLIPTAGAAGRVDFDNIHTPADDDFVGAIALDQMVREGSIQETMTIGFNVTDQP